METQYSFIVNSNGKNAYSVVMSAWYIDQEAGNRVELASLVKADLNLKDAFLAQGDFMDKDYRVEEKSELKKNQ